ncbi:MAG: adenylate cyclase [Parasphingorhabdus sp.]|jgi:adenylate cyclase
MTNKTHAIEATNWTSQSTISWVLEQGRFLLELDSFASRLGETMLEAGAPIWRIRLAMRTLHPLTTAVSVAWNRDDQDNTATIESAHGLEQTADYGGSPFVQISINQAPYRKQLFGPLSDKSHPTLLNLKSLGGTDYFGLPVYFSTGAFALAVFITDTPGGFSNHDMKQLQQITSAIAPVIEINCVTNVSRAIADTYLGARTGRLVLDGHITRGHVENINAAILMCDIRDWTGLNQRLPIEQVLRLANIFFEVMSSAIQTYGGEILKFIGDGILAIFPCDESSESLALVCDNALRAAQKALVDAKNENEIKDLGFGMGLHVGEVLYGNIGSTNRLDFTVLGQAVNLAARIEGQCSRLNRPLLFSAEFYSQLSSKSTLESETTLKGFDETIRIYAPAT